MGIGCQRLRKLFAQEEAGLFSEFIIGQQASLGEEEARIAAFYELPQIAESDFPPGYQEGGEILPSPRLEGERLTVDEGDPEAVGQGEQAALSAVVDVYEQIEQAGRFAGGGWSGKGRPDGVHEGLLGKRLFQVVGDPEAAYGLNVFFPLVDTAHDDDRQ